MSLKNIFNQSNGSQPYKTITVENWDLIANIQQGQGAITFLGESTNASIFNLSYSYIIIGDICNLTIYGAVWSTQANEEYLYHNLPANPSNTAIPGFPFIPVVGDLGTEFMPLGGYFSLTLNQDPSDVNQSINFGQLSIRRNAEDPYQIQLMITAFEQAGVDATSQLANAVIFPEIADGHNSLIGGVYSPNVSAQIHNNTTLIYNINPAKLLPN